MRRRFPPPNLTILFFLSFMIAGYAEFVGSIHQVSLRLHVLLPQIMRWSPFPPISSKAEETHFPVPPG